MVKRRRRYQWLPVAGFARPSDPRQFSTYSWFDQPIIDSTTPSVFAFPLIRDEPVENDATFLKRETLAKLQDIIIERIVGSIYCNAWQYNPAGDPTTDLATGVIATAGIAVLPIDEQAPTQPLVGAQGQIQLSPTSVDNSDQPWMWRRQWVLSNFIPPATDTFGGGPSGNAIMSDLTGPHVDVRSVRRIRDNERLFCIIESAVYPPTATTYETNARVAWTIDLRVLGAGRRPRTDGTLKV